MFKIKRRVVSLYEIFDVSETASPIEIKRAYKKLALEYHPDKVESQNDPGLKAKCEYELIKINNAKDILLDPIKRADYDKILRDLRSKVVDTTNELIVEISDTETINIEWDTDSFSDDPDHEPVAEAVPDFMIRSDETKATYQPAPVEEPREPAPDFKTIQRRFLTFCPRCGSENLGGGPFCQICNCSLMEGPGPVTADSRTIPIILEPPPIPVIVTEPPKWRVKCPRCSTENLRTRDFCIECNANLKSVPGAGFQEAGYFICPHCGSENPNGNRICISCYQDLTYHEHSVAFPIKDYFRAKKQVTLPDDNVSAQSIGVRQCPNCGSENGFEREYCFNCNMNLRYYREMILPREIVNQPDKEPPQSIELQECPHCGNRNRIESRFCGSCYKNLTYNRNPSISDYPPTYTQPSPEIINPALRKCPGCNTLISVHESICHNCGVKFIQKPD